MSFMLNNVQKYETFKMFRGKAVTVSCLFKLKRFCFRIILIVIGSAEGIVIYKICDFFLNQ